MNLMKIAIIGTGYVGLVTGTCFAAWGHTVVCVDKSVGKIAALSRGIVPIYEPGLEQLVADAASRKRLSFTVDLVDALKEVDVVFIAVGTPARPSDGEADLSFVYAAAQEIAQTLDRYAVVVVKSTVPVGTGDIIERILARVLPGGSFSVASNPEFLREGSAIADFQVPDRVVIGTEDDAARRVILDVYAPLIAKNVPIVVTQRRTSELIKYAVNSFLATKITYMNEIADLCECVGADIGELAIGIGLDHRVGATYLNVGPGYGGSCFPKDTLALLRTAQDFGVSLRIVEESVSANNARKRRMALKVMNAVGGSVDGMKIAIFGLSFKPDTDDMRDAPSIPLIETLQRHGAAIQAFDPAAMLEARKVLDDLTLFDNPYDCARDADALVIVTDWDVFKSLDLKRLREDMKGDNIIDLRNIISVPEAALHGLRVTNLGSATPRARENMARETPPSWRAPSPSARRVGVLAKPHPH